MMIPRRDGGFRQSPMLPRPSSVSGAADCFLVEIEGAVLLLSLSLAKVLSMIKQASEWYLCAP